VNYKNISQNGVLSVMVVDDERTNRQLLSAMLRAMGHQVIAACSGEVALQLLAQHHPDLVLMDVEMPGMNGFAVVREMRRLIAEWFPIVFISAKSDNGSVLEGLRAGGDDYLFKPFAREILQAKIRNFHIVIEQKKSLLVYRERIEDEVETAREFIKQFTAMDKVNDPLVRFFHKPAENFSGDLIAVARKPDKTLHVLLADSAGHGLTAALAVIPITQPFYQMTEKGFEISAIAQEINRRVRDYLPLPRFVAAAMLSFDPQQGTIRVWNGGCPAVLLLDASGREIRHRFVSKQLPLGVVSPAEFDNSLDYYALNGCGAQLLLCSDGATEISLGTGHWGQEGLLQKAGQMAAASPFERVVGALEEVLQDRSPDDDIALLMVDCAPVVAIPPFEGVARHMPITPAADEAPCGQHLTGISTWEFSLTLSAQQLKHLDVVPFLLGITAQIEGEKTSGKLFMVLSELFNNALDHGVLKLDSRLKNLAEDGMEKYFSARATRLAALQHGQIVMHFAKLDCGACSCLKIILKDSGGGFDYVSHQALDPTGNQQYHGRGIALLRHFCNALHYTGNGSEVTAFVALGKE